MKIEVLKNVFERNDSAADENRASFDTHGITCVNLLGGAGCGKTTLLEAMLPALAGSLRVAVLEGDLATTKDADRIAALNVPVIQLLTDGGCHLNATMVQEAVKRLPLDELDLVIIENVGNPICPANFDLGEHLRVAALSVAEGDDKPSKYPLLFKDADAIVLTKCDLLAHIKFDPDSAEKDLARVNADAAIFRTEAARDGGIAPLKTWLLDKIAARAKA